MTTPRRPSPKRKPRDLSGLSFAFFGQFSSWPSAEVARNLGATVSPRLLDARKAVGALPKLI